ncbi:MAG: hypothetical protein U9P50_00910 [Patescibacteria group bacterium]|nr:hypothetical protein [Patescibacteria group bacterium]
MPNFRERNNIQIEYSGNQDASEGLRDRLITIISNNSGSHIGIGNESYYLHTSILNHKTKVLLNKDCIVAISAGSYDEVFEALEIFLNLVKEKLYIQTYREIWNDVYTAFNVSGSVYTIDGDNQVVLKIDEGIAESIEDVQGIFSEHSGDALDFFRRALNGLLTREKTPNDIIKDFAISIENYIKVIGDKDSYKKAIISLRESGIIAPTQQGVLDKLYAYRGDADGVAHSGNTDEPSEVDAVWFLETLVAQVKLIEAKIKAQE